MDKDTKVRENRLRRKAARQGLRLVKPLHRDPDALGYGRYFVKTEDGTEAPGFTPAVKHGLTLDEVEERLTVPRAGQAGETPTG